MKNRLKPLALLCVALVFTIPLVGFFATAHYGDDGAGVRFISRPPLLTASWGPRQRFIVQSGVNFVPDRAPSAQAGNFLEFGVPFSEDRVSLRFFSWSWADYEFQGWRSNHTVVKTRAP